jgi:phosphoglycerol transferase
MKIAVIDSFPNLPRTAEKEFIKRLIIAGNRIGVEIITTVTSDDIYKANPDFVIATHEYTPKLTEYLTIGAMWSPPSFFKNDIERVRNVLSYDGYLSGSLNVTHYLQDILSKVPNRKEISDFIFLPSSPSKKLATEEIINDRTLMYSGVHWDGHRHGELFYRLSELEIINLYGPSDSWRYVQKSYRGEIPFDGSSIFDKIQKHGLSLCLHKKEHRVANTPSMRLFEAVSAGAVVISDKILFAEKVFGDTIFYLDTELPIDEQVDFVKNKTDWVKCNPKKALEMSIESNQIFNNNWSLEILLGKVINFASAIKKNNENSLKNKQSRQASLDVIIRCGSRELSVIKRSVQSVINQTNISAKVILVDYSDRDDIRQFAKKQGDSVKYILSKKTGYRSTALWDGLRNVKSNYFAVMDDDDWVMPNHWYQLISALQEKRFEQYSFAYSGVVRVEEDGAFINKVNFNGIIKNEIKESRELRFLDFHDEDRLITFDNYIQSNAWVADSNIISKIDLTDPSLVVAEDVYLYILFYALTSFLLVPIQTARWSWRSNSKDNSMLSVDQNEWVRNGERIHTRLKGLVLRSGKSFQQAEYEAQKRIAGWATPPSAYVLKNNLTYDQDIFNENFYKEGFHWGEKDGVWTKSKYAWFRGDLPNFCRSSLVAVDFTAADFLNMEPSRVKIFVNGYTLFDGYVDPWQRKSVNKHIKFESATNNLVFTLITEKLFIPSDNSASHENRKLGVYLSAISAQPTDSIYIETTNDDTVDTNTSIYDKEMTGSQSVKDTFETLEIMKKLHRIKLKR